MSDLRIVGITRYSVIFQRSFAATRGLDIEAARAVIWRPERLRHREMLFRAITLPSLDGMAQEHAGFAHILMMSEGFPEPFRQAMLDIARERPWFHIVEAPAGSDFSSVKSLLATLVREGSAFVFRLDDDDALAPRSFVRVVLDNAASAEGTVLSPDCGYMIRPAWNGASLIKKRIPFVSAGLGVYTRGPDPLSIHDLGNQNKIDGTGRPVIHATERLWLRSKTDTSDTRMNRWKKWGFLPTSRHSIQRCLDAHFRGLDADAVIVAITTTV